MTDFATLLDFVWNDRSRQLSHIVPDIAGFDADEMVPAVCGLITKYADVIANYDLCPDCLNPAT